MVAFTQLPAPIDITPVDDSTFKEIDVSAHVTNASGVLFRIRKVNLGSVDFAVRKKGSTDNVLFDCVLDRHQYVAVGIDADDIFELLLETSGGVWEIDLIGYYNADDFVFFDNFKTLSPPDATWTDWDISSFTGGDTAIAAVCWATNDSTQLRDIGFRKKGSTDNFIRKIVGSSSFPAFSGSPTIGVDGSEVFQVYRESSFVGDIRLIGYAKSGVTMNTNAVDASIGSTGSFVDLPIDMDQGAFFDIFSSVADRDWGLRPDGDTDYTFVESMSGFHTFSTCGAISELIEGQINNVSVDFWVTGTIDADASGVTAAITESGPSFTESVNTTLTAAINAAITESGPNFTESISTTLIANLNATIIESGPAFTESISATVVPGISASITEQGPSFTEAISATVTTTSNIVVTITETGPSFTESINTVLGVNLNAAITEQGPVFTESSIVSITKETTVLITETGPSFTESILVTLPITITVNPKNIIQVKRKSNNVTIKTKSNTITVKRKSNIIRVR